MDELSQNNKEKLSSLEKPEKSTQEVPVSPERESNLGKEKDAEGSLPLEKKEEAVASLSQAISSLGPIKTSAEDQKLSQDIEAVLAEDMEELYKNLPENLRSDFKKKGEKTAQEIKTIITQAKVVVFKIVKLIKDWLLMVPGVNKFFLEQTSKIKTQKILDLSERIKKGKEN
ncbi:hypothetical protein K9K85_01830 [Patescibacteria group bacterium]|nr:hypothetical protein [Patescibacteria group bacterium]